jgi:hypothetical protein
MSLESKAKTTAQIYNGYDHCNYGNYHAGQKWVLLEEANKQLLSLAKYETKSKGIIIDQADKEINRLKSMITDVKEILDNCPFKDMPSEKTDVSYKFIVMPIIEWRDQLKNALVEKKKEQP